MEALELFRLAGQSILGGLETGRCEDPLVSDMPEELRDPGACFVTLKIGGAPRG